jgi:hypothetical protein
MAPETGSQRTIERPDSVSRVIPPTTTIAKTSAATASSHVEIAAGRGAARAVDGADSSALDAMAGDMAAEHRLANRNFS